MSLLAYEVGRIAFMLRWVEFFRRLRRFRNLRSCDRSVQLFWRGLEAFELVVAGFD
jgi:hypothetical protein